MISLHDWHENSHALSSIKCAFVLPQIIFSFLFHLFLPFVSIFSIRNTVWSSHRFTLPPARECVTWIEFEIRVIASSFRVLSHWLERYKSVGNDETETHILNSSLVFPNKCASASSSSAQFFSSAMTRCGARSPLRNSSDTSTSTPPNLSRLDSSAQTLKKRECRSQPLHFTHTLSADRVVREYVKLRDSDPYYAL